MRLGALAMHCELWSREVSQPGLMTQLTTQKRWGWETRWYSRGCSYWLILPSQQLKSQCQLLQIQKNMYMLYAIKFKRQFVLRKSIYHIYRYFHIIGRLLIHVTITVLSIFFTLPAAALILYPCITSSIRKVSQIHCGRQLCTLPITCSAISIYML